MISRDPNTKHFDFIFRPSLLSVSSLSISSCLSSIRELGRRLQTEPLGTADFGRRRAEN